MLKKSRRIKTSQDFARVFRQGKVIFCGPVACKVANNQEGFLRIGFSLSKKHLPKAVSRNRLRRVLSGALMRTLNEQEHLQSLDLVFFTVKRLETKDMRPFASLAQSIVEYLRR